MGNYQTSPALIKARAEAEQHHVARRREIDRLYPKMERPCGTPGAVYTIIVKDDTLGCTVALPFSIETSLPVEAQATMKKALHDAVLPIVEQFYKDVWADTIAGREIDDTGPMPAKWGLLFQKWIRRCWARGERPVGVGNSPTWGSPNWYQLADEYKWPDPTHEDVHANP